MSNEQGNNKLSKQIQSVEDTLLLLREDGLTYEQEAYLDLVKEQLSLLRKAVAELSSDRTSNESPVSIPLEAAPRILCVDDDAVQRVFTKRALERGGFEVVNAENGHAALALLESQEFNLVITDCQMTLMDGFELVERYRSLERRRNISQPLPILALTAHTMTGYKQRCLASGMNDFRNKPIKGSELVEVVRNMLRLTP